jgi:rubrerythrin
MSRFTDPYTPETAIYECYDCGHRLGDDHRGPCPACEGAVRNIGISRE